MKRRYRRSFVICSLIAILLGGSIVLNPIFFKSLFHMNSFYSGNGISEVRTQLNYSCNGYFMDITGTGEMSEFIPDDLSNELISSSSGWRISIMSVTFEEGVTSISSCLFMGCTKLKTVQIASSITKIGVKAFAYCDNLKSINYSGTTEEWKSLSENSPLWNDESFISVVYCSDGQVIIN